MKFLKLSLITCVLLGAAVFFSNYHIVTAHDIGLRCVRRESFGFSEIWINVDAITSMPWISAKSRFPLGCRILEREGIIESEAARAKRIEDEIDHEIEKAEHQEEQRVRVIETKIAVLDKISVGTRLSAAILEELGPPTSTGAQLYDAALRHPDLAPVMPPRPGYGVIYDNWHYEFPDKNIGYRLEVERPYPYAPVDARVRFPYVITGVSRYRVKK